MSKKLILTSLTAIAFAIPAMAEPSHTSSTFPNDDLMQQDYTYQNQANYTNMGLYEGTVTANAEYDWNYVDLAAGEYLPANSTEAATCTAGSFCVGGGHVHYDDSQNPQDQGITSCATLENGAYPSSAAGASANTQCYRTCAIANNGTTFTNIAHATAVSGNDYYNTTATDTCEPTACENGWHVKAAVAAPDLNTAIGNDYPSSNPTTNATTHTYSLTYSAGTLTGKSQCSTQEGTYSGGTPTMLNSLPDSGGWYCYCQLTSWQPTGQSTQSLSGFWVYATNEEGATSNCANTCTGDCASFLIDPSIWRTVFLNSVQSSPAMCEANQITINWTGATEQAIADNNAASTVYGGDVRTPSSAIPVTGKTFKGWRFEKPTTPSQGD